MMAIVPEFLMLHLAITEIVGNFQDAYVFSKRVLRNVVFGEAIRSDNMESPKMEPLSFRRHLFRFDVSKLKWVGKVLAV
jgi:hypothetical protein